MKSPADNRQRDLCRRLAEYADVYADSQFLDEMHFWGNDSGRRFTEPQADAIDQALLDWKRRINSARFDPDRCPFGYDQEIWGLAGQFRDISETYGLPCQGRRIIYQELNRVIRRDKLDKDYTPWLDKNGKPGWVRMLSKVIALFIYDNDNAQYPYSLCQQLAQPGVIRSYSSSIIEQAKLDLVLQRDKQNKLKTVSTPQVAPARQAAVRAYINTRGCDSHPRWQANNRPGSGRPEH